MGGGGEGRVDEELSEREGKRGHGVTTDRRAREGRNDTYVSGQHNNDSHKLK